MNFVKRRACLYVVVQTVGAVIGAGILRAIIWTPDAKEDTVYLLCTKSLGKMSLSYLLGYEIIITFVLVLTVFATCDSLRSGFGELGPLAIGLSVSMCHLWAVRTY